MTSAQVANPSHTATQPEHLNISSLSLTPTNSPTNPAQPTLLGIPPELRDKIYSLVLLAPEPIPLHFHPASYLRQHHRPLVHVCRTTLHESHSLYYSGNTFVLPSIDDAVDWLAKLGRDHLPLVQKVQLRHGALECGFPLPGTPPRVPRVPGAAGNHVARRIPGRRSPDRFMLAFVLRAGGVAIGAVGGKVEEELVETAREALAPLARYLDKLEPLHQLVVQGTMAHCKLCALKNQCPWPLDDI
ncbi:hypothetical protein LTR62_005836 [Meristemomyces frigidus]|uniref:Uncharacterized protein n=1 Tax=Meristemomyces frigidus TaxID=1508187 RepID=A0AAN7YEZ6_9PEZI|nr:hypothetical protein LTR62_005836 [Meristemomyces frigidus]